MTHPLIGPKRPIFETGPKRPAPVGPKRLTREIGPKRAGPKRPDRTGIGPKRPGFLSLAVHSRQPRCGARLVGGLVVLD